VVGVGHFWTTSTFPDSNSTPFEDTTCPKKLTFSINKEHFFSFKYNLCLEKRAKT